MKQTAVTQAIQVLTALGIVVFLSLTMPGLLRSVGILPPHFEASVSIPDFVAGEDPIVTYQRVIRVNMRGEWTVDVERFENNRWQTVCNGGAAASYGTHESVTEQWSLSFYAGVYCFDEPGEYRTVTTWKMTPVGSRVIEVFWNVSEPFNVTGG